MGRKIDMKKIEDVTKCQVTFSKRRSSLIKKANEVAVCCDVDVAFVAFSPSGRVSKFCNQRRIEDVLNRYVNLPVDKRLNHISNVQEKMEKLRQLNHIKGDASKLQYLDKQIENLELQIKKSGLELQILETDLRDYEFDPEQEPSLHQLSWCERNLNHSLERVISKKNALSGTLNVQSNFQVDQMDLEVPFSSHFDENGQVSTAIETPSSGQILMQLDPNWISPYSAGVSENILQDLLTKYSTNGNPGPSNFSIPSNFPILDSQTGIMVTSSDAQIPAPLVPMEQSLVDQSLVNFHDQNNVAAWNNISLVNSSDAIFQMSNTQSLCNIQAPRFTSITTITTKGNNIEMPQSLYDKMGIGFQSSNSNLSQFNNMEEQDQIGRVLNMDFNNSFNNGNPNNAEDEDSCRINSNENGQTTIFDNILPQENLGDNTLWTSKNMQKSASFWEWEDLLLDDNFNLENI